MIKVTQADEPEHFDTQVRQPGLAYLEKHPEKAPYPYWKNCRDELYKAYHGYCAYTTFKINSRLDAVVDHFLPKAHHAEQCYEWTNYRLSSFHINAVKKDSEEIADPFLLPENAFRLEEDMKIEVNEEAFLSDSERELARRTITRLKLNEHELVDDRTDMMNSVLKLLNENADDYSKAIVAKQLHAQSRFLYQEAVRLKYITPVVL
ncbi:MAG: hypothetical protein IJN29_06020 [Akkermansia sp.]|nr:hypothetical protein [Akkermansia sp.]